MITKKQIDDELHVGTEDFEIVAFDSPKLPELKHQLDRFAGSFLNPTRTKLSEFEHVVIVLKPDSYGTGFNPALLVYVVFVHRKTGKMRILSEYYLTSPASCVSLSNASKE